MNQHQLESIERRLTTTLAAWGAGSVAIGSVLMAAGRGGRRPDATGFGRQALMWGAIDAAIAGAGALSRSRRGTLTTDEVAAKARGLQIALAANALADVGYVVAGSLVTARARRGQPIWRMSAGDGVSIAVQGAFLLALDSAYLVTLSRARRSGEQQFNSSGDRHLAAHELLD